MLIEVAVGDATVGDGLGVGVLVLSVVAVAVAVASFDEVATVVGVDGCGAETLVTGVGVAVEPLSAVPLTSVVGTGSAVFGGPESMVGVEGAGIWAIGVPWPTGTSPSSTTVARSPASSEVASAKISGSSCAKRRLVSVSLR